MYLVRFHYIPPAARKPRAAKPARLVSADRQRKRITRIVEGLPEADAVAHGPHLSLEVKKKRFGWFLADHHGDGRVALNCRANADMHDVLQQLAPTQFHVPKYLGTRGWVGLWLDVPRASWHAVELALREAYRSVAPKRLQTTAA